MKSLKSYKTCLLLAVIICLIASSFTCSKSNRTGNDIKDNYISSKKMNIRVNSKVFTATLADNATAKAFGKLLPITIGMTELNGNEKYFDLAASLPAQATNPGQIQNGDIMLYGSRTLVLFYKSFATPYNYTRIGQVDNIEGFAKALGEGNVSVTFDIQ